MREPTKTSGAFASLSCVDAAIMRVVSVLLVSSAASTLGLELAGFSQYVAECAACEAVAREAQEAMVKDARTGILKRDATVRLELLEKLCTNLEHAYPKKSSLKGGMESLRFVKLEPDKVDDPDEAKVKALETAKHAGDLPEKIVRGKEKNVELRVHCERLLEDHDEALSELIRRGGADTVRTDFCVHTASQCTKVLIDRIDESEKPFEPEMPVGMRPEDWPMYKKQMYNEDGSMRTTPLQPKKKKKKKRARK